MQTLFFMMIFCLFIFTLLSGCGTKGDLYIPDRPSNSKIITKG
ncbi:MAG: hypothetical protein DSZ29_03885 [Aquificaceae bacterium]|nr:MAG: hypothetical protein DSZ29_03885 [Aquificaceae bacterium]